MNPKISIIIPTYNRVHYLVQAINSVLAQDYENLEIIVGDNASSDTTKEIIKPYLNDNRVKYYVNTENIGMVNNWKKALYEYASGDWFILLSDDDYLIDNSYLSKVASLITNNQHIVLVYASGYILHERTGQMESMILPFEAVNDGKKIFLSRGTVFPEDFTLCNIVFNRSIAISLQAFSNPYNISCDSELFLKMCLYGDVGVIREKVSVYRVHDSNLIKALNQNFDFLFANIDFYLNPYLEAKEILSQEELMIYESRVVIPCMQGTLLHTKRFFPEQFSKVSEYFQRVSLDVFQKINLNKLYRLKLCLAKFPKIYLMLGKSRNFLTQFIKYTKRR